MQINKETVNKLAKLARLNFSKDEAEAMVLDLKKMLKFINKLDEINTDDIKPLNHIHLASNIYRDDEAKNRDVKTKILENAPNHNSDYIKVPKVVKK